MPTDDQATAQPPDPMSAAGTMCIGVYFLVVAALTFYLLVSTWPVVDSGAAAAKDQGAVAAFAAFSVFGWNSLSASSDIRLFITVIAAGALGSLIHCVTSFADYVGNRRLSRSWMWWLILRTPIGVALALLFYLVLRGGLIVPTLPSGSTDTSHFLNPYGIAAISAMAGMFSKQATDKLGEIFDTLFRTTEAVHRADPLSSTGPHIESFDPPSLTVGGSKNLDIKGRNFETDCRVFINDKIRERERVADTRLKVKLTDEDVAAAGQLEIVIQNPTTKAGYPYRYRFLSGSKRFHELQVSKRCGDRAGEAGLAAARADRVRREAPCIPKSAAAERSAVGARAYKSGDRVGRDFRFCAVSRHRRGGRNFGGRARAAVVAGRG